MLSCWDRMLVFGTLPKICYAEGMTSYLYARTGADLRLPEVRRAVPGPAAQNAERLAAENGIEIEFLRKRNVRKEDRVKEVLAKRGEHPGLVCIFSAMEPCSTYKPWHDKRTGKTYPAAGRRQVPALLLLFHRRRTGAVLRAGSDLAAVPAADLFQRAQLAGFRAAQTAQIDYKLVDNAFVEIADWRRAQQMANGWRSSGSTTGWTSLPAPTVRSTATSAWQYHWSVDQCEYATDIVFKRQADLAAIYGNLTRTAIHTVKPDNIATFLGRKLNPQYEGEVGNRFNIRIEGTRIKHTMGPVSLKLYDKFGLILRIETTVNDLTFFKHYREVEHRDGTKETKWASMQKTIYSLPALRELLEAANRRYLEFLSTIEDPRNGRDKLDKLSQTGHPGGPLLPRLQLFRRR